MPHIFCLSNIPFYSCNNKTYQLILGSCSPPSKISHTNHNLLRVSLPPTHPNPLLLVLMAPKLEKPRVTEIKVRMDCNGCVQKIKKALHGIQGIYEVYPDIAQQKLTIIGWADPERIVKAIRKTRKIATICSHSEPTEEQPPDGGAAPPEAVNPPPSEAPPPDEAAHPQPQPEEAPPAAEPPKDQPPPENPQTEPAPPATTDGGNANQQPPQQQPSGPKDVGEVHVIYHHPPDYGHRYGYVHNYGGPSWSRTQYPQSHSQGNTFYPEPLSRHPNSHHVFHHEPPQQAAPSAAFVTHSYNTYKPSPNVTEYHEYVHNSPPPRYTHYSRIDHYNEDYHNNYSSSANGGGSSNGNGNGNGNITSIFSDENPNACRIM